MAREQKFGERSQFEKFESGETILVEFKISGDIEPIGLVYLQKKDGGISSITSVPESLPEDIKKSLGGPFNMVKKALESIGYVYHPDRGSGMMTGYSSDINDLIDDEFNINY